MGGHNVLDTPAGRVAIRSDRMAATPTPPAASDRPHLPGQVTDVEYQGTYVLLGVKVDNPASQQVSVSLSEAAYLNQPIAHGQHIHLSWLPADAHPLAA